MRPLLHKIKPATGLAPLLHVLFRLALPLALFVLSSINIEIWLPLIVVFLSKWRIFAVRPRFWPTNLRANAVDIMFGVSIVIFMASTESVGVRLSWALVYGIWLVLIKPRSNIGAITAQASLGQLAALSALFIAAPGMHTGGLVLLVGLICFLAARHFFDSFGEPYAKMLSYLWGYFGAAIMWILGHLLLVYPRASGEVAQPTLFLSVIGYTLAAFYFLGHAEKLTSVATRELIFISGTSLFILLIFLYRDGMHLIV